MEKDKYIEASRIASEVMVRVVSLCQPGAFIRDICRYGDGLIMEKTGKVFKSQDVEKGIAYPACVNVNNIVSAYSPLVDDDRVLVEGDVVKVRLGVHIDGFISTVAHTLIARSDITQPVTGPVADCICACYLASELVLRALQSGRPSEDIQEIIERTAKAFNVTPVHGISVAATTRFVPENPQKMLLLGSESHPFTVAENEAYTISVRMTTAKDGYVKEASERYTLCKRNVHKNMNLKLHSGRAAFEEITNAYSIFPFAIRDLMPKIRLGLREGLDKGLFEPVGVVSGKNKSFVAEYTYTVLVKSDGTSIKITNPDVKLPYVHSEFALPQDLQEVMTSTQPKLVKMACVEENEDVGDQMEI